MASRRGRHPETIGALLKERIDALGWEPRLREEDVITGWDAAVGPQIAAHARPSHVTGHRLTVVTASPVWTQQLSLLKPELLRRIARSFGPDAVTDLYFVNGRIDPEEQPQPQHPAPARPPALTELSATLEAELAEIADPGVRDSMRCLMLVAGATAAPDEPGSDPA